MCELKRRAWEINREIAGRFGGYQNQRSFLLRYALDEEFLPDAIYSAVVDENRTEILDLAPWLRPLVWVRLFFERGDGMNFRAVLKSSEIDLDARALERDWASSWRALEDGLDTPGARFLAECFVLSGGEDGNTGRTSRLWRVLSELVSGLEEDRSDTAIEGVLSRAEEEIEIPVYLRCAYQQAPGDLLLILQALKARDAIDGHSWTRAIGRSQGWSLQRDNRQPILTQGLYRNGHVIEPAIRIKNLPAASEVTIHQGEVSFKRGAESNSVDVREAELRQAGLDPAQEVIVQVGRWKDKVLLVPQGEETRLFRIPGKGLFCREIDLEALEGEVSQINAKELLLLLGDDGDEPVITYDGSHVEARSLGSLASGISRIYHLDFSEQERYTARELVVNGKTLCLLGNRPWISSEGQSDCVSLGGNADGHYLSFGDEVRLIYHGPNNGAEWSGAGDSIEAEDVVQRIVRRSLEGNHIETMRIRFGKAQVKVTFLPQEWEGRLGRENWEEHDWQWKVESNPYQVRSFAERGIIGGVLTDPLGEELMLEIESKEPLWWRSDSLGLNSSAICESIAADAIREGLFHVWFPWHGMKILLGESCLFDVSGPGYWVGSIGESLNAASNASLDGGIANLVIKSEGSDDCHTLCETSTLPDCPVLGMRDGMPTLYLPQRSANRPFSVIVVSESSLVTDRVCVLRDFRREEGDGFLRLDHEQQPGDGRWFVLVEGLGTGESLSDLISFLLQCSFGSQRILSVLSRPTEGVGQTMPENMKTWNGGLEMSAEQCERASGQLRCVEAMQLPVTLEDLFERFQGAFSMIGNGREFWLHEFPKVVQLEGLGALLGILFRSGFNWLAEPGWLPKTYELLRLKAKQGGESWTKRRRQWILDDCPLMMDIVAIQGGYPYAKVSNVEVSYLDHGLTSIGNPEVFEVSFVGSSVAGYAAGAGLAGIDKNGLHLQGGFGTRKLSFDYAGHVVAHDPRLDMCRLKLLVNDDSQAIHYLCEEMDALSEALVSEDDLERLNQMFTSCVESNPAVAIIGNEADRSLGYLFRICDQAFNEMAEENLDQRNRSVIFKAAVLTRLHAWVSRAQVPVDWPLSDPIEYDFLCALCGKIWGEDDAWEAFCSDFAGIEWLLAWFHLN